MNRRATIRRSRDHRRGRRAGALASETGAMAADGRGADVKPVPMPRAKTMTSLPGSVDLTWEPQPHHLSVEELWTALRNEARMNSIKEPSLASYLYSSILSHESLAQAIAFILANKLASSTLLNTQLMDLFYEALSSSRLCRPIPLGTNSRREGDDILDACVADLLAVYDRDPACDEYSQILLYFKGYQAIQSHRIAHWLREGGRDSLALALQSRVSEVFHVDIHPGAKLGKGIMLDHATGVVIGETAVIGDNVSMLHHVTLGGSGTEVGDRHPKIGNGVLIGAGVSVLGNIRVGTGAKIGAGSVVLKDVPEHSVAVGVPAKVVKLLKEQEAPALDMDQITGYTDAGDGI